METIKEIVAYNCKRLLDKSKDLSEIARLMQISPTTISRWKSGVNSPELEKIDRLAEILEVDAQEFFRSPQENVKNLPMSKALKLALNVPDKIYDLAEKLGHEHDIWDDIYDILNDEITYTKKEKKSSKA